MPEPLTAATFCATLVDEWARLGLTDAVVCPGSRSTPMALALDQHVGVRVHVHHDERSGAFTAIGLALATRRPVAVLTTSGTAAVELHPAVVEASYAGVPLLALTADRPPELQGVGAPQTIDQRDLYGRAVRAALHLDPPSDDDAPSWRGLARRAWSAATGRPAGPVQVDLAFREPLLGEPGPLPPSDASPTTTVDGPGPDEVDAATLSGLVAMVAGRDVLVVAGGGVDDPPGIAALAEVQGWPVLADQRSGCRGPAGVVVAHGDALLRDEGFAAAQRPEVVLRFGRPPASKVVGRWLAGLDAPQVLVEATGLPADPDGVVQQVLRAAPGDVGRSLLAASPAPSRPAWLAGWAAADRAARGAVAAVLAEEAQLSEPAVARATLRVLPDDATLVVSSSMPVRDLEWYGEPRLGVRVLSNRGANGIDGVTSTAVGAALAGGPTACLVGDVAFLHDTNGLLGAARRHLDLVVVVVDNDGGGIFSFLPPAGALEPDRYERLFGTPHGVDLGALAEVHGATVALVDTVAALEDAVELAVALGGLHVVVARTDRQANVAVHDRLHGAVSGALVGGSGGG